MEEKFHLTLFLYKRANKQCWGKLLLKVIQYNIKLLPIELTNCITYFYIIFALLFLFTELKKSKIQM